ncbi:MAG: OmpA family protein [Pseudomonadota bacterium]
MIAGPMIRATALILLAAPAAAVELALPGPAEVTFSEVQPLTSHRVAIGALSDGMPFETVEGAVTRQVFAFPAPTRTPLQVLEPIRAQLQDDGWEIVFTCGTRECGGFEFRFEVDVTPAPQMFVDLAAYRYLAARRDTEWVTMVVSRSGEMAFVQTTHVGPASEVATTLSTSSIPAPPEGDLAAALDAVGRAILPDLDFATGSAELPEPTYPSLAALSAYLEANPETTIALVGHTDAAGGAVSNMAISQRRADSARTLLVERYGVDGDRIDTHGVGFFAPMGPNDTDEGRRLNRRVEAVITSTE